MSRIDMNPNVRITSNLKFEELTIDDIEFYDKCSQAITSSHALPFDLPIDEFFRIVFRSLRFFWEYSLNGVEEVSYYIPLHEIQKYRKGTGYSIQLPFSIENVYGWHVTNQVYSSRLSDFLRWNLLQTYSYSGGGYGGGTNGGFRGSYGSQNHSVSNNVIALYEFESYKEMFGKIPYCTYNNNTCKLNVRGGLESGLILDVYERIPPEALYTDLDFEMHVIASVEEQLGRIVTAFDFKMIGDVAINYEQIKERGIDKKNEIETSMKEASDNHDFIFFKG